VTIPDETPPDNAPPSPADQPVGWRSVVKACVLVVVMTACLVVVYASPLGKYFEDPEWRRRLRHTAGPWLPVLYLAVGSVLIGVGFLRTLYTFLGGALFGFLWGAVWGHAATMIGSMGCFWVARALGREWAERKWRRRFEKIEQRLRDQGFPIVLLIRLCPVGNNYVTNCLAGVSPIGAWPFFNASFIGHAPYTLICALWGSGVAKAEHTKTAVGLALFLIIAAAFTWYFRRSRLAAAVAAELRDASRTSHPS